VLHRFIREQGRCRFLDEWRISKWIGLCFTFVVLAYILDLYVQHTNFMPKQVVSFLGDMYDAEPGPKT